MAEKTRAEQAAEDRRRRAEESLKANLRRRKEQARARRSIGPEEDAGAEAPAVPPEGEV
ncbi:MULTISPECIES: hypothetical protein [unclassified Aureimonas]|uniref:hypothetical protein n=1 Tax=unclassified Aureimonas TaxID=2615206 RepID=UPI000A5C51D5|nr:MULTISPECIES: hypothetical protein [unclassified Aureimonas]